MLMVISEHVAVELRDRGKDGEVRNQRSEAEEEDSQRYSSAGGRCICRASPAARTIIDMNSTFRNTVSTKALTESCGKLLQRCAISVGLNSLGSFDAAVFISPATTEISTVLRGIQAVWSRTHSLQGAKIRISVTAKISS
jgi:hypothetical protein